MGISLIPGSFLARNAKHVSSKALGLVLGRQKLHLRPPGVEKTCQGCSGQLH